LSLERPSTTRGAGRPSEEVWLASLVEDQRSGYSLSGAFYTDPRVFERDIQRVYAWHWFFVGHASRIPQPGDYFVVRLADTEFLVVRGGDGRVRALLNVCRHRGSRLCSRQEGTTRAFVCPYHAWAYDTTGSLMSARNMPAQFSPADHGLRQGHVRTIHGLIFVSLAEEPPDLEPAVRDLAPYLEPHEMTRARVPTRQEYPVEANWKLVLENFLECYHCPSAHPEYCLVNPRAYLLGLPDLEPEFAEEMLEWIQRATALGHKVGGISKEAEPRRESYGISRVPLGPGFKTSSEDGEALAPLMGAFKDYDGGQTQFAIGPVSYGVADCDHAILFRFLPLAPRSTSVELTWIVDESAEEGRDYDLDRLTWLWKATFGQDRVIIGDNQRGVDSRFYEPGPYSQTESITQRWVEWYLAHIT